MANSLIPCTNNKYHSCTNDMNDAYNWLYLHRDWYAALQTLHSNVELGVLYIQDIYTTLYITDCKMEPI